MVYPVGAVYCSLRCTVGRLTVIIVKDESFQYFMEVYLTIMDTEANSFGEEHLEYLKAVMWTALFNSFRSDTTDNMACKAMRRVDDILENRKVDAIILGG